MTTPTAEESRALLETLTGYTPGPWTQSTQHGDWGLPGTHFIIDATGKSQVASVEYITPYCAGASRKEREDAALADDNARLIAASPDLAAHLRAALDREIATLARAEKAEADRERLALAICGGEDVPVYCNAATVEELEAIADQEHRAQINDISRMMRAEAERDAARAEAERLLALLAARCPFCRGTGFRGHSGGTGRAHQTSWPCDHGLTVALAQESSA